jgi:hypothetical protein
MHVINGKGNIIPIIAGLFILISVAMAVFVSIYWLLFTAFVGVNLIISGVTGFCLMEKILVRVGIKERKISL